MNEPADRLELEALFVRRLEQVIRELGCSRVEAMQLQLDGTRARIERALKILKGDPEEADAATVRAESANLLKSVCSQLHDVRRDLEASPLRGLWETKNNLVQAIMRLEAITSELSA